MSITMYQSDRNFVSPANDASLYAGLNGDHNGVLKRDNQFAIIASGLTATIDTGQAIIQGRLVEIIKPETLSIPANGTGSICLVVDLTKQNTVTGSAGGADYAVKVNQIYLSAVTGTLTQDDLNNGGYIYELPLASYVSTATSVSIVQNNPTFVTSGVLPWTPNTNYVVGDLVTFNTLGDANTGLLTNPIFICSQAHTSTGVFPDSTNAQWTLINSSAYYIAMTYVSYAVTFYFKRFGKIVDVSTSALSHAMSDAYFISKENGKTVLPDIFKPINNVFLSTGASIIQFDVGGNIIARGSGNTVGSLMAATYNAMGNPVWNAGAPT